MFPGYKYHETCFSPDEFRILELDSTGNTDPKAIRSEDYACHFQKRWFIQVTNKPIEPTRIDTLMVHYTENKKKKERGINGFYVQALMVKCLKC